MDNKKTSYRIKILTSLMLSFLLVSFFAPRIFLNDTPTMKPSVLAQIKTVPYLVYSYVRHPFDEKMRDRTIELANIQQLSENKDLSYKQIVKGVYAAEDKTTATVHVRVESGTELEVRTITLSNGQTLKVFIPVK